MSLCTVKWDQRDKTQSSELKYCSSKCAYDCAQLQYTKQHRTVPAPLLPPDNHHSSDVVYWKRGVQKLPNTDNIKKLKAIF